MKAKPIRPSHPDKFASASERDAKLPHDRDGGTEAVHEDGLHKTNREPMEQARRDVEAGILDTERIGTPNDLPTKAKRKPPVR